MVQFDYDTLAYASLGGLILGLATSLNYIIRGKVTGMSGIVYGIISYNKSQIPEKLSIVGGMFFISAVAFLYYGYDSYDGLTPFGPKKQIAIWTSIPGFIVSGFLVGFGTKLGNGCTSGHGLCGIPRLSLRSIVAVCTFLFTGIGISTAGYYYGLGPLVNSKSYNLAIEIDHQQTAFVVGVIGLILPIIGFLVDRKSSNTSALSQIFHQLVVFIVGVIFAAGLMISGMSRRKNILDFLQIKQDWNPALMCVLGCGLLVNFITFTIMRKKGNSLCGNPVFDPQSQDIDFKLVFGAFCFGLGWGIGGLCPGPFLVLFSVSTFPIQICWGLSMAIGMMLASRIGQTSVKAKTA